eukprot:365251-Chlamydomonas_euryale.AAC.4
MRGGHKHASVTGSPAGGAARGSGRRAAPVGERWRTESRRTWRTRRSGGGACSGPPGLALRLGRELK